MSHSTAPTAPPAPDSTTRYYLGNIGWITLGLAAYAAMLYILVNPDTPLRIPLLGIVLVAVVGDFVLSTARSIARRRPTADAAVIADSAVRGDERQERLRVEARAAAGVGALCVSMVSIFLGLVAAGTGLQVITLDDWINLSFTFAYGISVAYTITFHVAARYFSRKG